MSEEILPVSIEERLRDSYLSYSLSVIVARALPDVRDGLKPVHRRILYAGHELGLDPKGSYRKSARLVGEVLGKYHPHGETSIYDAIVRMAQDFNLRYPLVDGHGNFGSLDGDGAAAMRYTEARLSPAATEFLSEIEEETVPWVPNFDNTMQEPTVLPARIPNLLINGASGIAVGMSTNIPPHNLGEVIDALLLLLEKPGADLDEIMRKIPGPDLPTGGIIMGTEGIREAYATGNGKIVVRGVAQVSNEGRRRQIIISELPYQVNKAKLIEQIADQVRKKKLEGVTDLRDESAREGIRIVLDLASGAKEQIILNRLYKHTPLQTSIPIQMLALSELKPQVLTLKQVLDQFLEFRREVIGKRSQYRLVRAQDRQEVLLGLALAIDHLDQVIAIIRRSRTQDSAKKNLCSELGLSERQSEAVLAMPLRRLVGMEHKKIKDELTALAKEIKALQGILGDPTQLDRVLRTELAEVREVYADPRRTQIQEDAEPNAFDTQDLIPQEEIGVSLSHRRYLRRGEEVRLGKQDLLEFFITTTTHHQLLFLSQTGQAYVMDAHQVPGQHGLSIGDPIRSLVPISAAEEVVGMMAIPSQGQIVQVTKKGIVKRTEASEYLTNRRSGIASIKLDPEDEVIAAFLTQPHSELFLATASGSGLRLTVEQLPTTGRNTKGVRGIRLKKGDFLIAAFPLPGDGEVLGFTADGRGLRIPIAEIPLGERATGGFRIFGSRRHQLALAMPALAGQDVALIDADGLAQSLPATQVTRGRIGGPTYQVCEGPLTRGFAIPPTERREEASE